MRVEIIIHSGVSLTLRAKCLDTTFKSSNTNHPKSFTIHKTMTLQWLDISCWIRCSSKLHKTSND